MRRGAGVALLGALLLATSPSAAEQPHILYMLHCQGCHQPDGGGTPGAVPALKNFVGLFLTIPGGREFLVRVPGSAQSSLDDTQLAAVLDWMIREFGPAQVAQSFEPYSAEEVARARARPLVDVEGARAGLVARIPAAAPSRGSP